MWSSHYVKAPCQHVEVFKQLLNMKNIVVVVLDMNPKPTLAQWKRNRTGTKIGNEPWFVLKGIRWKEIQSWMHYQINLQCRSRYLGYNNIAASKMGWSLEGSKLYN
jgi:hypothetical protein